MERALSAASGDSADWRFTLLCDPAYDALLRCYLLSRALPHIRIGVAEFAIVDAFPSGRSHPDSGHISVAGLTERWNCQPETLATHITLDFRSPTAFSLGKDEATGRYRYQSLPNARSAEQGARKRWSNIGGAEPGDDFDQWVAGQIDVEALPNLKTCRVIVERRPVTGFVGRARFHQRGDTRWLPLLHLLTDLMFWTGAGYQPTRGLGQVRRVEE